jgi:hypothetical protein
LALESKYKGDGDLLFDTALEKEWVREQMEKAGNLALALLETQSLAFRALIRILQENLSLDASALEAALTAAGIDVAAMLLSYPAAVDYQKQLEDFMREGDRGAAAQSA